MENRNRDRVGILILKPIRVYGSQIQLKPHACLYLIFLTLSYEFNIKIR